MRKEIGTYDAKAKLPELLKRVARGEEFTITNHGKAMADLLPVTTIDREKTIKAINSILSIDDKPGGDNESLKKMINAGRS